MMNILFDASLPPRFARALNLLYQPDLTCVHVRDILGNDASDQHVADYPRQHPADLFVAMDLDVTGNPHRQQALRALLCPVFLLSANWLVKNREEQAWLMAYWLPRLVERARAVNNVSSIFLVPADPGGRIRKIA